MMIGAGVVPGGETPVAQSVVKFATGHTGTTATGCILRATADYRIRAASIGMVYKTAADHGLMSLIGVQHPAPNERRLYIRPDAVLDSARDRRVARLHAALIASGNHGEEGVALHDVVISTSNKRTARIATNVVEDSARDRRVARLDAAARAPADDGPVRVALNDVLITTSND